MGIWGRSSHIQLSELSLVCDYSLECHLASELFEQFTVLNPFPYSLDQEDCIVCHVVQGEGIILFAVELENEMNPVPWIVFSD